jgi:hypothetical protein
LGETQTARDVRDVERCWLLGQRNKEPRRGKMSDYWANSVTGYC